MEREELIRTVTAAQNGDSEALNTLFNTFYNDVYYFALKTVKDDDLACDITQETFVEIINTLDKLEEPVAFVTWMKKITYHQCTRYFKKKKDVLVDEDEDGNTVFDTLAEERAEFIPDEALDKEDFRQTIMGMIDKLSDEQRAAVMMYYFDELTVKQIAEIQGVSEGGVKSRLNYARKAIKGSVEEYEKKNNVKLHSFAFLPLLLWLFRGYFAETMSTASAQTVAAGVSSATGAAISVSAGTGAAAAVTATATGIGAKIASIPVVAKVVAGIVAAAIVVGGGLAIADIATPEDETTNPPAIETTLSSEYEDNPQTTGTGESDIRIADSFDLSTGDLPPSWVFMPLPYEGMRFFSSTSELTTDEAARLLYKLWAGNEIMTPTYISTPTYNAIYVDVFDELCMTILGRTYDVTQLTGQFAEYNQDLDAVVMTCGTPFVGHHFGTCGFEPDVTTADGFPCAFVNVLYQKDSSSVEETVLVATIVVEQVDGKLRLRSVLEGNLTEELGGTGTVSNPDEDENQPTSDGSLRFDGYYYGLVKDDKVDCYVYLRFYSNGPVVTVWSVEALTNAKSRLDKNIADTTGDSGTYSGYYELSDGSRIKGELLPALCPDDSGGAYRGCISGTVEGDIMHLREYYTDVGTSQEVTLTFVPFE